jgi:cob(I)alamin adenosyltransferase
MDNNTSPPPPPPPKSKIYTRTGDKGKTSLHSGIRVSKTNAIIKALGDADELTSNIGVAMEYCKSTRELSSVVEQLFFIQCRLQELNSHIATPTSNGREPIEFDRDGNHTKQLEKWIDLMDVKLPTLTRFILPSGGLASSHLHIARAVCRRAERSIHGIAEAGNDCAEAAKFVNRLSDYLFTAARFACHETGNIEAFYQK